MRFKDLFKTAFFAIASNKLQALLSMLGVIIGIASVVVVVSISEGAKMKIEEQIAGMGTNTISASIHNVDSKGLILEPEMIYPMANSKFIDYVTIESNVNAKPSYKDNSSRFSIQAVDPFYQKYKKLDVKYGRFINDADMIANRQMCVIGSEVATEYFGNSNPIGESITITYADWRTNTTYNHHFQVIGVLEDGKESIYDRSSTTIYLPFSSANSLLNATLSSFYVIGSSTDTLVQAEEDAKVYIENMIYPYIVDELNGESTGGFRPPIIIGIDASLGYPMIPGFGGVEGNPVENYYYLFNTGSFVEEAMSMINTVTLMISAVAAISLLVGGIGIANVMFMSVLERTKEIGLRKAIGARNIDITLQFLIESVIITVFGGIIGLGLGTIIAKIVDSFSEELTSVININIMLITFLVSVATGVLAGYFPSRKASKLNPIDALRYE